MQMEWKKLTKNEANLEEKTQGYTFMWMPFPALPKKEVF